MSTLKSAANNLSDHFIRYDEIKSVELHYKLENIQDLVESKHKIIHVCGSPWKFSFKKSDKLVFNLQALIANETRRCVLFGGVTIKYRSKLREHQNFMESTLFTPDQTKATVPIIAWDEFIDPKNGFVDDNSCEFSICIEMERVHSGVNKERIELKKITQCCELSNNAKYRVNIHNFSKIESVCTPEFKLTLIPFRMVLYKVRKIGINNILYPSISMEPYIRLRVFNLLRLRSNPNWLKRYTIVCEIKSKEATKSLIVRIDEQQFTPHKNWIDLNLISLDKLFNEDQHLILSDEMEMDVTINASEINELPRTNELRLYRNGELECPQCFRNLIDVPVSAAQCGHVFCTECVERQIVCSICQVRLDKSMLRSIYLPTTNRVLKKE